MKDRNGLFECKETKLKGCYEIQPMVRKDSRGAFVKTFHMESFQEFGLPTLFHEAYHSISSKNVLRGLHFQTPPAACAKLVYCVCGKVWDVALDLRKSSPDYGKFHFVVLDGEKGNMFYLPEGMAHGFYTLSDPVVMMYKVTHVYDREYDTGIRWDSAGIPWPCENPILSERDQNFVRLSEFETPF